MFIAQITSEVAPFAYGDTKALRDLSNNVSRLSTHLASLGHNVIVLSPLYCNIDKALFNIQPTGYKTWVTLQNTVYEYDIHSCWMDGVLHLFFHNSVFFDRKGAYGMGGLHFSDNDMRFGSFCLACLSYIGQHYPQIDILHSHDWQTAFIPIFCSYKYPNNDWKNVFSIHDITNQGIFSRFSMEKLCIPWEMYTMEQLEFYDSINILKGGVVYSDSIVALDAMQAESFLMSDTGFQLDGLFRKYQYKLSAISSGIDYNKWDPQTDTYIYKNYTAENPECRLENKKYFCDKHNIPVDKPLFCIMNRYVRTVGLESVLELLTELGKFDINIIFYGGGDQLYINQISHFKKVYNNLHIIADNNDEFFHHILSSCDFMCIPYNAPFMSKERLVAIRYGAIPIERKDIRISDSGGLMRFYHHGMQDINEVLQIAIELYNNDAERWKYVSELMSYDNSWEKGAVRYEELYKSLI